MTSKAARGLCLGIVATLVLAIGFATATPAAGASESYKSRVKIEDVPDARGSDFAEWPMGRIEWMKERMGGELTPGLRAALLAEAQRIREAQTNAPAPPDGWVSLGPTNTTRFQNGVNKAKDDNGRLRTILPDPNDPDTVYILSSGGGLWKTTNFGAQNPVWEVLTDGIYATSGGAAAFGRNAQVLYLGSGDPFDLGVGGIMYKSIDGGYTWSAPVVLPGAMRILDVKVDTSQGSTTDDDIVLVGTDVGLYRSIDGGATYSYIDVDPALAAFLAGYGFTGQESWSLAKTSVGWLLAHTYWGICSNCAELTGMYFSTNRGATWDWTPDIGDLGANPATGLWAGRVTLAAGGPSNSVVYALAAENDGSDQRDIYKSTDGGFHFSPLETHNKVPTNPNIFQPDLNLTHGQAWYNHMIITDPTDATGNTVYAGGNYSSAMSSDGGNTWTILTGWLGQYGWHNWFAKGKNKNIPYAHADFHCAAVSTAGGQKRLLFGNDGGIFYSDDNGKSWKDDANTGMVTALIYAMAVGTVHSDNTLIGLQDNGTRFRVSGTTTWTGSIGGDGFGVGWSQANDDISMGSVYYLNIRRWRSNPPNNQAKYDDLLDTSNLAGPGDDWYWDSYFVTPIATPTAEADPSGHVFYTNTEHYLLKTEDGGDYWEAIWEAPGSTSVRSVSHGIGLAPDNPNYIALAGSGGHVVYTHNGGSSWSDVDVAGSIGTWPGYNSTAGWSRDHDIVYLASESVDTTAPHVARSDDGGATWTNATGDLAKLPINKLIVDPDDGTGNTVYVANWIGVYKTTTGGTSWSRVGDGLPLAMISDMYLAPDGSFLRVSSYGRGVWELALP